MDVIEQQSEHLITLGNGNLAAGQHCLIRIRLPNGDFNMPHIADVFADTAEQNYAHVVVQPWVVKGNKGLQSAAFILKESHVSLHGREGYKEILVDVFTCGKADPYKIAQQSAAKLNAVVIGDPLNVIRGELRKTPSGLFRPAANEATDTLRQCSLSIPAQQPLHMLIDLYGVEAVTQDKLVTALHNILPERRGRRRHEDNLYEPIIYKFDGFPGAFSGVMLKPGYSLTFHSWPELKVEDEQGNQLTGFMALDVAMPFDGNPDNITIVNDNIVEQFAPELVLTKLVLRGRRPRSFPWLIGDSNRPLAA